MDFIFIIFIDGFRGYGKTRPMDRQTHAVRSSSHAPKRKNGRSGKFGAFFSGRQANEQARHKRFEDIWRETWSKRTDYQRDDMRSYRAKQREAGATAIHANPMIENGGTGFNDKQLGQQ